jgi:hypothetical protein
VSTLHPARQWVLSLVLALLFAGLGWSALPSDITRGSYVLQYHDPRANNTTIGAPVFVLRDSGAAVRFGDATLTPDGVIRVGLYDPLDPLLAHATEAVTLPADPRLLWLLASQNERQALRDATAELAFAMSSALVDIIRSPEFATDYRERFTQVFRTDLRNAWQITRDSGAWQELLRGYEPILRETASRDLRPIIERHFRGVPMRMLQVNAFEILDPFHPTEWNMQPVEQALQEAIQEIRDRGIPESTVGKLLDAPPTARFSRTFIDALGLQLAHDTKVRELVGELVFDERFRPYLSNAIARAMDLGRIAPRLLVSLHGSTDLNPVASLTVRTLVSGRPDRVVVFMSPAQRNDLLALDPTAVHLLDRVDTR